MTTEQADEVSHSQYVHSCKALELAARALVGVTSDEAIEHWLPRVTEELAVIFSFVGSNMTARHMPRYAKTVQAMQDAKVVNDGGLREH